MAEDLFTLQQDAMRRARELHSRASSPPRDEEVSGSKEEKLPPMPSPEEKSVMPAAVPIHRPDLLESLFKDKDRTIILALLILLSGEGGDSSLIFALMYLLM